MHHTAMHVCTHLSTIFGEIFAQPQDVVHTHAANFRVLLEAVFIGRLFGEPELNIIEGEYTSEKNQLCFHVFNQEVKLYPEKDVVEIMNLYLQKEGKNEIQ